MLPISDAQNAYAAQVRDAPARGRVCASTVDERDEKVGRKIRDAEEQKVPAMLVVGEREAEANEVSLRRHGRRNLGARPLETVVAALASEQRGRWLDDREPSTPNSQAQVLRHFDTRSSPDRRARSESARQRCGA